MRWHVQGTDAATNRSVELCVDEADATRAIKSAIDRNIIVSEINRGKFPLDRYFTPAACLLAGAAAILAAALFNQNQGLQSRLEKSLMEESRLATSLEESQHLVADLRSHSAVPAAAGDSSAQVKSLTDELVSVRGKISLKDQQLAAVQARMQKVEATAARVQVLESSLGASQSDLAATQSRAADAEALAKDLRAQLQQATRRIDGLLRDQTNTERLAALEKTNRELSDQLDRLKAELLLAAARSTLPPPPAATEAAPPAITGGPAPHWALRTSYDSARDFLALHTDLDTIRQTPGDADGTLVSQGMLTANLSRLAYTFDQGKMRIFDATLTLSLAVDAPKDKLTQNTTLANQFIGAFAPAVKDPGELLASAVRDLPAQDPTRRLVFLADEAKITFWTTHEGLITIKIQAARDE